MFKKTAKETIAIQTKLVMPNDTNPMDTLFGGRLMAWMDEIASISAFRHSGRICVTASINNVSFEHPIVAGDFVTLEAKVSRAFNSSMEIFVDVFVEDAMGKRKKCNEAIFVFVAIDQFRNPIQIPDLVPETELEKKRFDSALRRKQLSLVLAGRMKPTEATELQSIFETE
ncbi:MAG: acyl-CoA thioesterase [Flavobacteriales bacterium]|jgi:acyl-CoA hydrolase|nr:acyl-CoA thioesterase [Flavobacteriales bacterium]